jgi:succinate-acetate transporter protein
MTEVVSKTKFQVSPLQTSGGGINGEINKRIVVVRYYLDRPGYDPSHSSARLWVNPPAICKPADIRNFLYEHCILEGFRLRAEKNSDDVLADANMQQGAKTDEIIVEVRLDEYQTFMSLEACGDSVSFDVSKATTEKPATLTLRLTDVTAIMNEAEKENTKRVAQTPVGPTPCNMTPAGLFAFSMIVGLEATETTGELLGNGFSSEGFQLIYGPYGFFVGGLLQLCVGMWEASRNNIYGGTAFSAFGCFWLGNGTKIILTSYFRDFINEEYLVPDPWGHCMRNLYILLFAMILVKQTLAITKVTTTLVLILCVSEFLLTMSGFFRTVQAIQAVVGWCLSGFAMFTFMAEFTNEVYHKEVFNLYPWNDESVPTVAAAVGRPQTLQSAAAKLRHQSVAPPPPALRHGISGNVMSIRSAMPSNTTTQ